MTTGTKKKEELTILPDEPTEPGALVPVVQQTANIVEWWHPKNLSEAMDMAKMLADSEVVPRGFIGMPGNILVAIQMGAEVGLPPMAALQNIAVINGRPALWGDAQLGVCMASPDFNDIEEFFEGPEPKGEKYDDSFTAVCVTKRTGRTDTIRKFSVGDAKKAKLWGGNTWAKYPKRMLQMRARGFALRDTWPDRLRGLRHNVEELRDLEVVETQVVELKDGVHQTVTMKPKKSTSTIDDYVRCDKHGTSYDPNGNPPHCVYCKDEQAREDPREDVTIVLDGMEAATTLKELDTVAKGKIAQSLRDGERQLAVEKFREVRDRLTPKDGDDATDKPDQSGFGFEEK